MQQLWISIAAGVLAAAISLLDLCMGRRKALCYRATVLVASRMAWDGGAGFVACQILVATIMWPTWMLVVPVLLAGLAGTCILRTQLSLLARQRRLSTDSFHKQYDLLRKKLEDEIDDICTVAQSAWIAAEMCNIRRLAFTDVCERVLDYIRGLDRLDDAERERTCQYVSDVIGDNSTQEQKYRALVSSVVDLGGRRFVKDLVRVGRKAPAVVPQPSPTAPRL